MAKEKCQMTKIKKGKCGIRKSTNSNQNENYPHVIPLWDPILLFF